MKKLLLTTILFTALCCLNANASSTIVVDYQGETVVRQNTIERNLLVNCEGGDRYNIAVKPLDSALKSSDGKVEIPLQNVYLNNNQEDVYLRYNEYSELFNGLELNGVPRQVIAKVRDFGMVPAGIYNLTLEIQATDVESTNPIATSIFNLQFIIHNTQSISLHGQTPQIIVKGSDALKKSKVVNEASPMVYINSNCDWVLYINTDNYDNSKGKMYIRTVSASSDVRERLQERVLLEPNKEIIIAKGKAPCNNQFVTVEYSVENDSAKYLRAGNFEARLKYVIREDK